MTLTINMTPELESRLQEQATRQGLSVPDYARMVLEKQVLLQDADTLPHPQPAVLNDSQPSDQQESLPLYATATPDEWERAFDQWVQRHGVTAPDLPDTAFSREHMYGDRG